MPRGDVDRTALSDAIKHRQLAQVSLRQALQELEALPRRADIHGVRLMVMQLEAAAQLLALPVPSLVECTPAETRSISLKHRKTVEALAARGLGAVV
jgi:hypothetical protein